MRIHFPSSTSAARADSKPLRLPRLFCELNETAETNKRIIITICSAEYGSGVFRNDESHMSQLSA